MATAEIMATRTQTMPNWVRNTTLLWDRRRLLLRVAAITLVLSAVIAFLIPKRYESVARLMPPEQPSSGAAMLAALAGHSLGGMSGLGSLAGLLGGRTSSALFIDLLHSRSISDHIIDRFDLQRVYKKRYRIDTVKYLAHHTTVIDDKKSGVITVTFNDTDPRRAQAITQAYLDELNSLLTHANTSSARREREFIEKRLVNVQAELQSAEKALGQFSSNNVTFDIKEQTHAMVDAAAKLQGELIVGQSELDSLQQIYGEGNVRVRAARARIGELKSELAKMSGSPSDEPSGDSSELYPSLRQIPKLAVPYADLYRRVKIQETVFELLSEQYEMSRIEEAKDTPVVSVFDLPLVAEKKSFPPRLLIILIITALAVATTSFYIVLTNMWQQVSPADPRKMLANEISQNLSSQLERRLRRRVGGQ
ncbi:MAG TPA: Wzz/FepE/Etk N-terminal domain-containing protein [Acidobacteriaceae bacterium]|nr:Wzz/FepE/Etk N-terminal domain-containing protein [Acidobacteriaceae bacterium]